MNEVTRDVAWELYERLLSRSPTHATKWKAVYIDVRERFTANRQLPSVDIQIQEINRFWHAELGLAPMDTRHARSCLIPTVSADVWLSNFEKYVMSTILQIETTNGPWEAQPCA